MDSHYSTKHLAFQIMRYLTSSFIMKLCLVSILLCFSHPQWALADSEQDGFPETSIDVSTIPDAVPVPLPLSRFGNPPYYDVNGQRFYVLKTNKNYQVEGVASWYGTKFQGKRTSSGEPYNMFAMTAASPTLPIPSFVEVTNLENGRKVIVKVNDRGPFHEGRVMDLSYTAAKKLGILGHGTSRVKIVAIHLENAAHQPLLATQIYLQIASFRQASNASSLAQQLRQHLPHPIIVSMIHQSNHPLYRVLVGPFQSMTDTTKIKPILLTQGIKDSIAIQLS